MRAVQWVLQRHDCCRGAHLSCLAHLTHVGGATLQVCCLHISLCGVLSCSGSAASCTRLLALLCHGMLNRHTSPNCDVHTMPCNSGLPMLVLCVHDMYRRASLPWEATQWLGSLIIHSIAAKPVCIRPLCSCAWSAGVHVSPCTDVDQPVMSTTRQDEQPTNVWLFSKMFTWYARVCFTAIPWLSTATAAMAQYAARGRLSRAPSTRCLHLHADTLFQGIR